MRCRVILAIVTLLAGLASAQDKAKPEPDTPEQAADTVLAASPEALKTLAQRDKPDPWLVADDLCARGEHDAAEAFARAAPRKDVDLLPAYVAARRANAAVYFLNARGLEGLPGEFSAAFGPPVASQDVGYAFASAGYQTFWIGHNYKDVFDTGISGFQQGFADVDLVP